MSLFYLFVVVCLVVLPTPRTRSVVVESTFSVVYVVCLISHLFLPLLPRLHHTRLVCFVHLILLAGKSLSPTNSLALLHPSNRSPRPQLFTSSLSVIVVVVVVVLPRPVLLILLSTHRLFHVGNHHSTSTLENCSGHQYLDGVGRRTLNIEHRTSNIERRTVNAERRTPNERTNERTNEADDGDAEW